MAEKLPKNVAVELDDDMCIEVQAQHIHAAGVFASKDDTSWPILEAVCIRREGDAIKIQATDNFRLISIESRAEEDGPDETILLPYKAVKAALPKKGPVTLCLNHQSMMLSITSCDGDKAIEVLEKASEVQGALRYEGQESGQVLYALAETVTACLDLASALGCSEEQFQKKLDTVNESNARKEH